MSSTGLAPVTLEAATPEAASAHVPRHRRKRLAGAVRAPRLARFAAFLLGTVWLVIVLVPIYYMVLASFRTQGQYLTGDPWLPTGGLSLSSYRTVLSATGIGVDFRNSAILTLASIVIVVVFSLGAAYRIVRRGSRFAAVSFRIILFGRGSHPGDHHPDFIIVVKIHLYDTLIAVILAASVRS